MEPLGGGQRLQNNEMRVVAPGGCQCYFGRLCAADLFFFSFFFSLGRFKHAGRLHAACRSSPYHLRPALLACHAVRLGRLSCTKPGGGAGGHSCFIRKKKEKRNKRKVPNAVRITATLISAWR